MKEEKNINSDIEDDKYFILRKKVFLFLLTLCIIWFLFMLICVPTLMT